MHTIVILTEEAVPDENLTRKLRRLFPECRIEVRSKKQNAAGRNESDKQLDQISKR